MITWDYNANSILQRIGFEYVDSSHAAMEKIYKINGIDKSPDASWYLQLVMTDPDFENKGEHSKFITAMACSDLFSKY